MLVEECAHSARTEVTQQEGDGHDVYQGVQQAEGPAVHAEERNFRADLGTEGDILVVFFEVFV